MKPVYDFSNALIRKTMECAKQIVRSYGPPSLQQIDRENLCTAMDFYLSTADRASLLWQPLSAGSSEVQEFARAVSPPRLGEWRYKLSHIEEGLLLFCYDNHGMVEYFTLIPRPPVKLAEGEGAASTLQE